jgi:hypothetical protein
MSGTSYTGEQVSEGLIVLAACGGSSRRAAAELGVPRRTIEEWREERSEQYRQLEEQATETLVNEVEGRMRANALTAVELEEELLHQIRIAAPAARGREAADYLRVVTDAKNKNLDGINKIRGQRHETPSFDLMKILQAGQHSGWLKLNVSMEVGDAAAEPPVIEGHAEDAEDTS